MSARLPPFVLAVIACAAIVGAIALNELSILRAAIVVAALWVIVVLVALNYRRR